MENSCCSLRAFYAFIKMPDLRDRFTSLNSALVRILLLLEQLVAGILELEECADALRRQEQFYRSPSRSTSLHTLSRHSRLLSTFISSLV